MWCTVSYWTKWMNVLCLNPFCTYAYVRIHPNIQIQIEIRKRNVCHRVCYINIFDIHMRCVSANSNPFRLYHENTLKCVRVVNKMAFIFLFLTSAWQIWSMCSLVCVQFADFIWPLPSGKSCINWIGLDWFVFYIMYWRQTMHTFFTQVFLFFYNCYRWKRWFAYRKCVLHSEACVTQFDGSGCCSIGVVFSSFSVPILRFGCLYHDSTSTKVIAFLLYVCVWLCVYVLIANEWSLFRFLLIIIFDSVLWTKPIVA